jgi:hypothetical protein
MATQTVEFRAAPGLTLTAKLFTAGSDTVVQTASAVTEATNRKGTYAATFTDPGAAEFELIALSGTTPVARWFCTLTLTTATFQTYEVRAAGVVARVTANTDQWGGVTVTGMPLPTTSYTTPPTAGTIADAVWDEAYNQHTTAGTFGKLMDILRKSNTVIEGTILATPTPTTTVFRISGANYPTGALEHSVLWMNSGASQEQNSPILTTTNNGDGTVTVTLEEALVTAPSAGDTVLIDPTSHVHAITDIQAGLATLDNQTTINNNVLSRLASSAYTAPDNSGIAAIKVVTDRVNTGLVQDGAVWQFTVNMLENGPAGAGGGSATLQNQELILDHLDLIQNKTDLITSSGAVTSLLAGAVLEPGTIQGFPTTLKIGDSYTAANGRAIDIPIVDTDGIPLDTAGSLDFSAATVTFTVSRAKETNASRIVTGTATVIDPPGTGTANAPYVRVEISSSETAKGLLGYRYTATLKFTWSGTGTDVMSFESSSDIVFDN